MFEGFTNVPINENAAVRVVGYYSKLGGYIDNTPGTVTFQLGDNNPNTKYVASNEDFVEKNGNWNEQYGARVAGLLKIDDDWTVNSMLAYQTTDSRGNALFVPKDGDLNVHEWSKPYNRDKWVLGSLTIDGKLGIFDVTANGSYLARQTSTANDYTYYSLFYDSTPGYTNFPLADGTFLNPIQHYRQPSRSKQESLELRFATPQENRWRVQFGGFFENQPQDNKGEYYNPGLSKIVNVSTHVPRPIAEDTMYLTFAHIRNSDYAGFVEGSYEITDQITLTGGIRYYNYLRKQTGTNGIFRGAIRAGCTIPLAYANIDSCVTQNFRVTGSGETHKVNLQYQVTSDKMLYATYSTGYRPGGFNTNAAIKPYGADTLDNFEIGYKTTWAGVLRLNGAFYYEKWNGMQFAVTVPNNNGQRGTYNAGQATVKGAEADVTYLVTNELTLSGNVAYNDGKLSKDLCNLGTDLNILPTCTPGPTTVSPKGTRLPFQPKLKMSLTARYEKEVSDDWTGYVQAAFNHQSNSTNDIRGFAAAIFGNNPAYSTVDFSVGAKGQQVGVEFFMQNAFDKRGIISKSAFCPVEICPTTLLSLPIKPQFFGLKVSDRF